MKRKYIYLIGAILGFAGIIIPIIIVQCPTPSETVELIEERINLNFRNWYPWGGIQSDINANTVILNGKSDLAGFSTDQLPQNLKGYTVILEISNAAASNFYNEQMLKITVNNNDRVVIPINVNDLIEREYIPSGYRIIEFILPSDFDGKLGFVFYRVDLKDLQITATYKSTNQ